MYKGEEGEYGWKILDLVQNELQIWKWIVVITIKLAWSRLYVFSFCRVLSVHIGQSPSSMNRYLSDRLGLLFHAWQHSFIIALFIDLKALKHSPCWLWLLSTLSGVCSSCAFQIMVSTHTVCFFFFYYTSTFETLLLLSLFSNGLA